MKFLEEFGGSCGFITIIDVHGDGDLVQWVVRAVLDEGVWVARGRVETVSYEGSDQVLVIDVVALFQTVMCTCNFCCGLAIWGWRIGREFGA